MTRMSAMALSRRTRPPSADQSGAASGRTRGTATPVWRRMRLVWGKAGAAPTGAEPERARQASLHA
eukprot:9760199-Alexandrium_andersonii.AAC.1